MLICMATNHPAPALYAPAAACETHQGVPAVRVVEYRIVDPFSATGDEHLPAGYLLVCAAKACEIAAFAAARMSGADERTITAYPLTPALAADLTGAHEAGFAYLRAGRDVA